MSRKTENRPWFSTILIIPWCLVLVAACLPSRADAGSADVDLELVLAVDASDSMSRTEMLVQRIGYIVALRSADVRTAIAARGGVALTYVEWAGPDEQRVVVPWTVLSDTDDAAQFADELAAAPLIRGFGSPPWETGTSISQALLFAADMFSASGSANRIIDISGNGPSNSGGVLPAARQRVIAEGITINGLAITTSGQESHFPLGVYYEDCVIGGTGAFAMAADEPSLFKIAIRRKLVLEIAGPPARLIHADYRPADRAATDCSQVYKR